MGGRPPGSSPLCSRHYSSNRGPCVNLFVPGTGVVSAGIASDMATATMTGTSMAASHVTGAATLYLHDYPNATPAAVKNAILYASTANVVSNTGVSPNRLFYIGFGSCGGTPTITGSVPGAPTGLVVNCYGNNLCGISWTAARAMRCIKRSVPPISTTAPLASRTGRPHHPVPLPANGACVPAMEPAAAVFRPM